MILIECVPDAFYREDIVLADLKLREAALDLARKRRAHRRYAHFVGLFAEVDGPEATAKRRAAAPLPRMRKWNHLAPPRRPKVSAKILPFLRKPEA